MCKKDKTKTTKKYKTKTTKKYKTKTTKKYKTKTIKRQTQTLPKINPQNKSPQIKLFPQTHPKPNTPKPPQNKKEGSKGNVVPLIRSAPPKNYNYHTTTAFVFSPDTTPS